MAGIGFELKKIFQKKSLFISLSGYIYATFVTVGPILICVSLLLILRTVMREIGVDLPEQNLFLAAVTYSFIFSLIISSSITMMLSRYLSDMIYTERVEKILPSAFSSVATGVFIGAIPGIIFYLVSPLPLAFELLAFLLYEELIILFILMVYISAVKDYKRITLSFVYGLILGILTAILLLFVLKWNTIYSLLASLVITFFTAIVFISNYISAFFTETDHSYFEYLSYIRKRPQLILINIFYMVSIFVHNFIIWHSSIGIEIANTYLCAPSYDVPAYYAMLSTLPATIIFVVRTETSFYKHYRNYMHSLAGGGTLDDLKDASSNVTNSIFSELAFVLEIQFMITCFCIIIGRYISPYIGFTETTYAYFAYLCLGYFTIIATYIITCLMLYFDEKNATLRVMSVFIVTHCVFVFVFCKMSENLYGLGTFIAGFITLVYSLYELVRMTKILDYRLYCTQPIVSNGDDTK